MTTVTTELRQMVTARAGYCCEYCRLGQDAAGFTFHIEHIVAEKHGGQSVYDNLALSCPQCNSFKGTDLSSIDWEGSGDIERLYHPRIDNWHDHFSLDGAYVVPLTAQGRVTVFLLRLNSPTRLLERELLIELGEYPCTNL